jgi:hypothetical protein
MTARGDANWRRTSRALLLGWPRSTCSTHAVHLLMLVLARHVQRASLPTRETSRAASGMPSMSCMSRWLDLSSKLYTHCSLSSAAVTRLLSESVRIVLESNTPLCLFTLIICVILCVRCAFSGSRNDADARSPSVPRTSANSPPYGSRPCESAADYRILGPSSLLFAF